MGAQESTFVSVIEHGKKLLVEFEPPRRVRAPVHKEVAEEDMPTPMVAVTVQRPTAEDLQDVMEDGKSDDDVTDGAKPDSDEKPDADVEPESDTEPGEVKLDSGPSDAAIETVEPLSAAKPDDEGTSESDDKSEGEVAPGDAPLDAADVADEPADGDDGKLDGEGERDVGDGESSSSSDDSDQEKEGEVEK